MKRILTTVLLAAFAATPALAHSGNSTSTQKTVVELQSGSSLSAGEGSKGFGVAGSTMVIGGTTSASSNNGSTASNTSFETSFGGSLGHAGQSASGTTTNQSQAKTTAKQTSFPSFGGFGF